MENIPKDAISASLKDYYSRELRSLVNAADIVSDLNNINSSTAVTIVNLVGQNITDIQQLIASGNNLLAGKSVSHVAVAANPR